MTETFGERIRRLRKERGLWQKDIAKRLSVCPGTVSSWEQSAQIPQPAHLRMLAEILGVPASELDTGVRRRPLQRTKDYTISWCKDWDDVIKAAWRNPRCTEYDVSHYLCITVTSIRKRAKELKLARVRNSTRLRFKHNGRCYYGHKLNLKTLGTTHRDGKVVKYCRTCNAERTQLYLLDKKMARQQQQLVHAP